MTFKILTIFPQMIENVLSESILGRARKSGAIQAEVIDIRPFSQNKHKNTDDTPFGGGAGMVMLPQPVTDAIHYAMGDNFKGKRIYLSPRGKTFDQKMAEELAKEENLILLCGHYEGLDQRVIDESIDEEISVGDYVLTGGELGALIITDAVSRLVKGVLGSDESSVDESFSSGLLEYPQYTRPREFDGIEVPQVLLDGNQKLIDRWRRDEAIRVTYERRPEMLTKTPLDKYDRALVRNLEANKKKLSVAVRGENAELQARIMEESEFSIELCDENRAEALLIFDENAENIPQNIVRAALCGEYIGADERVLPLCAAAFDARFNLIKGDEGIESISFFGLSKAEFACCAAAVLPVKKGIKGYCADYGKSRRAYLKQGTVKKVQVEYFDGTSTELELCGASHAYIKAITEYIFFGKQPRDGYSEDICKIWEGRA